MIKETLFSTTSLFQLIHVRTTKEIFVYLHLLVCGLVWFAYFLLWWHTYIYKRIHTHTYTHTYITAKIFNPDHKRTYPLTIGLEDAIIIPQVIGYYIIVTYRPLELPFSWANNNSEVFMKALPTCPNWDGCTACIAYRGVRKSVYVCVCMCVCTYVCIFIFCICMCICMCMCMCTCMYMYVLLFVYKYTYVYVCVRIVYICVCTRICTCINVCVCICSGGSLTPV